MKMEKWNRGRSSKLKRKRTYNAAQGTNHTSPATLASDPQQTAKGRSILGKKLSFWAISDYLSQSLTLDRREIQVKLICMCEWACNAKPWKKDDHHQQHCRCREWAPKKMLLLLTTMMMIIIMMAEMTHTNSNTLFSLLCSCFSQEKNEQRPKNA